MHGHMHIDAVNNAAVSSSYAVVDLISRSILVIDVYFSVKVIYS